MSNPTETLPPLTDDLRPNLRRQSLWMTCFRSWLASVKPSEARELLRRPAETVLREVDNLTWAVMAFLLTAFPEDKQLDPDSVAEALRQEAPNWEDEASAEELDREQDNPLTDSEDRRLTALAEAAHEAE
jgi:hypothetical protein